MSWSAQAYDDYPLLTAFRWMLLGRIGPFRGSDLTRADGEFCLGESSSWNVASFMGDKWDAALLAALSGEVDLAVGAEAVGSQGAVQLGLEPSGVTKADEEDDPRQQLPEKLAQAKERVQRARDGLESALSQVRVDREKRVQGRALLGVGASVEGLGLWRAYELRAGEDPSIQWELKDAYHLLHDRPENDQGAGKAKVELLEALTDLARLTVLVKRPRRHTLRRTRRLPSARK